MSDTTPKGIKITDFPVASQVAPDDFIPILDSSTGIMQRTTTNHAATNDSWGPGTETEYGHNKTIDNFNAETYEPGESLSAHAAYEFSKNLGSVETADIAVADHVKDEYFVFKGQMVRAIADIAATDRIQLGTNVVFATVGDSLKGLNGDVATLHDIANGIESHVSVIEDAVSNIESNIGTHKLEMDVVIQDDQYGYINTNGEFVDFKSQADIDAAVAAAMQGNAAEGDVVAGKTFTNSSRSGLIGTFAGQTKSVTASRSNQTVSPDSGKYLTSVTVNKFPDATGDYECTYNSGAPQNNDMGVDNNYRRVNANNVFKYGAVHRSEVATLLGTVDTNGATFNLTGYPNYKSFTNSNFYYTIEKIKLSSEGLFAQSPWMSYSGEPYAQVEITNSSGNGYPSLSYDSSTGILTVKELVHTSNEQVTVQLKDKETMLQSRTSILTFVVTLTLKVYILPFA